MTRSGARARLSVYDFLPMHIIVEIILGCDPLTRMTFVLCLSKRIRRSLLAEASLWQRLDVKARNNSARWNAITFSHISLVVNEAGFSRYLSLINKSFVREFRVSSDDNDSLACCHIQQALESLPNLTCLHLELGDYADDGSVENLLTSATELPWVANLKKLQLRGLALARSTNGALMALAQSALSVESLCLPSELTTEPNMMRLADAWRAALDGHPPRLAEFTADNDVDVHAWIGRVFPRLHTLHCGAHARTSSIATLSHLRELHVSCYGQKSLPPKVLADRLRALVMACPSLEKFTLFGSVSGPKDILVDGVCCILPPSLKELFVIGCTLRVADFPRPLPALMSAGFYWCRVDVPLHVFAARLRAMCPHLATIDSLDCGPDALGACHAKSPARERG